MYFLEWIRRALFWNIEYITYKNRIDRLMKERYELVQWLESQYEDDVIINRWNDAIGHILEHLEEVK